MKINRVLLAIFILIVCFLVIKRYKLLKLLHIREQYEVDSLTDTDKSYSFYNLY